MLLLHFDTLPYLARNIFLRMYVYFIHLYYLKHKAPDTQSVHVTFGVSWLGKETCMFHVEHLNFFPDMSICFR